MDEANCGGETRRCYRILSAARIVVAATDERRQRATGWYRARRTARRDLQPVAGFDGFARPKGRRPQACVESEIQAPFARLSKNAKSPFDEPRVSGKSPLKSDPTPLRLSLSKPRFGENRQSGGRGVELDYDGLWAKATAGAGSTRKRSCLDDLARLAAPIATPVAGCRTGSDSAKLACARQPAVDRRPVNAESPRGFGDVVARGPEDCV